ncbi:DNA repair protein rhp54 [Hordeum vulgare]|nr:DNA repair protein rhp54 [Hordeum vulgare]
MDDDLEVAAIASMSLFVVEAEARGKAAAPPKKKKKELTPEEQAMELAKTKGWRHAQDARGEAAAAAAAQQKDTNARVKAATREALLFLGSLLRECSLEVSIVAPSTPAPVTIDLNAAPMARGSLSGGMRKRKREMPPDMLTSSRNLFDGMPTAVNDDTTNRFLENMIFKDDAPAADQFGLDGFPLGHEFLEDYDLEEEDDDMDIDGEPLFEEELANQTAAGGS